MSRVMAVSTGPESGQRAESLEDLFRTHEGALLRYAQRLVHSFEVAEEIVQEAFMKLHAHFHEVRQPKAWLYRTTHNLALNHLRDGQKIVPLEVQAEGGPDGMPAPDQVGPDQHLFHSEALEHTRRCLETLEARQREVVRLKFEENFSYKQIAAQLNLSEGNVGYILHHALKQLAADLERLGVSL